MPRKRATEENCLASKFPELVTEWHPSKNGSFSPQDVTYGSKRKAWWVCSKNHEWRAVIKNRTLNRSLCPYCAGKAVDFDNCLATTHPELTKEWHFTKNGNRTPYDFIAGSHERVWWKCDKADDHEWEAAIRERTQGDACPCCRGLRVVHSNCLATTHPQLAKEWHPTKNGDLTPFDVVAGSGKKVWWNCDKGDDHEWAARVVDRSEKQSKCPCCDGRKTVKSNCLRTTHPKLAKEWHPTKNGSLTPRKAGAGSEIKVWWKCHKAEDHEWQATIKNRSNGSNCPFCRGKKVANSNCLAATHPELVKEWHPTKNGTLKPSQIGYGSGKIVWWICPKGHEWESPPNRRSLGAGCPFCANLKVDQGNCLATTHPDLAREWHPTKNGDLTPSDVVAGTDRKVWWKCDKGHEWSASVYQRSGRAMSGCPVCFRKISREAEKFFKALKMRLPSLVMEGDAEDEVLHLEGWSRKFDAGLPQCKVLLEYDGSYYHAGTEGKDKRKLEHAKRLGFEVIRIRQYPLGKISENDIVVPSEFDEEV